MHACVHHECSLQMFPTFVFENKYKTYSSIEEMKGKQNSRRLHVRVCVYVCVSVRVLKCEGRQRSEH